MLFKSDNNLIREERKNTEKENLKYQLAKKLKYQISLQNMRINDNKETPWKLRKKIEISMLENNIDILIKQLKKFKEKICKTENNNNDLRDKEMAPLNKKEKIIQEVSKTLWESQKWIETTKEAMNHKEKKEEVGGTRKLMRA